MNFNKKTFYAWKTERMLALPYALDPTPEDCALWQLEQDKTWLKALLAEQRKEIEESRKKAKYGSHEDLILRGERLVVNRLLNVLEEKTKNG